MFPKIINQTRLSSKKVQQRFYNVHINSDQMSLQALHNLHMNSQQIDIINPRRPHKRSRTRLSSRHPRFINKSQRGSSFLADLELQVRLPSRELNRYDICHTSLHKGRGML